MAQESSNAVASTTPSPTAPATPAAAVETPERSPLLTATLGREWNRVQELLTAGAEAKVSDDKGLTPLMAAAIAGHVPTIKALLANGAQVDALDSRGRSALGYAVSLRQSAAVASLLEAQPNLPAAAQGGNDLATVALESGDRQLIEEILRRLPAGLAWSPQARKAFSTAVDKHDTILGPLLVVKFAGAPAAGDRTQPLMAYAVVQDDAKQINTLLDFGCDPNTVLDQSTDTALRALVGNNFMRNYLDNSPGLNVLMLAAGMKKTAIVKQLLERGANRYASTKGKSALIPLYFAAWVDAPDTIQALLPNAPSKDDVRIEVSLNEQRARYFRDGQLVLSTTISTGRAGFATKPGEYVVTDKDKTHRSSIYHEASMPYFMRLSCAAFGLHEGVVTGRPASHGCIRLPGDIARRLFGEVPVGTWVTIR